MNEKEWSCRALDVLLGIFEAYNEILDRFKEVYAFLSNFFAKYLGQPSKESTGVLEGTTPAFNHD